MDTSYRVTVSATERDDLEPLALADAADHFGTDNEDELTIISSHVGHTTTPGGDNRYDATFEITRR